MIYAVRGCGASRNYVRVSPCKLVLWLTQWEAFDYEGFRVVGWRSMVGLRIRVDDWAHATGMVLEEGEYAVLREGLR